MSNRFYEHVSSDKKKWIMVAVCFVLVGVMLCAIMTSGFQDWNPYGWFDSEEDTTEEVVPGTEEDSTTADTQSKVWASNTYDDGTVVTMSALATYTNSVDSSVSHTLTATITPSTASNQLVDWSISWDNSASVSNYVTVTPASDGSLTATVTCYQSFEGDIFITVTTRDGGYQAICVVQYAGIPSSLSLDTSDLSTTTINSTQSIISLLTNYNYSIDIDLDNIFGVVGSEYYDFSVTTGGSGDIKVGTYTTGISGNSWGTLTTKSMSSIASDFFSATVSGSTLTISVGSDLVVNYYSSTYSSGYTQVYYDKFSTYNVAQGWFTVTVTCDEVPSLSQTINFVIQSGVTGVTVDSLLTF